MKDSLTFMSIRRKAREKQRTVHGKKLEGGSLPCLIARRQDNLRDCTGWNTLLS